MTEVWKDAVDKIGALAGKWTTYAAFGTFLLYLFGYLTLRFQLMAYGVVTNLDAFDEKYLFAGCSFLVNFLLALLVLLFLVGLLGFLVFLISRPIPKRSREYIAARIRILLHHSLASLVLGSAAALLLIQLGLRQCLLLHNVLLADELPDAWISRILLASEAEQGYYFTGMVAGMVLTLAMLAAGLCYSPVVPVTTTRKLLTGLLTSLIAIEFLFLPINFGMLINSRQLPRVAQISTSEKLPDGAMAWLVWESKDILTYFLLDRNKRRYMITIPRKDNQVSIVGSDPIFKVVFPDDPAGLPAK
jgi:hypothetical protein